MTSASKPSIVLSAVGSTWLDELTAGFDVDAPAVVARLDIALGLPFDELKVVEAEVVVV